MVPPFWYLYLVLPFWICDVVLCWPSLDNEWALCTTVSISDWGLVKDGNLKAIVGFGLILMGSARVSHDVFHVMSVLDLFFELWCWISFLETKTWKSYCTSMMQQWYTQLLFLEISHFLFSDSLDVLFHWWTA